MVASCSDFGPDTRCVREQVSLRLDCEYLGNTWVGRTWGERDERITRSKLDLPAREVQRARELKQ
jgi:hypothetical protein